MRKLLLSASLFSVFLVGCSSEVEIDGTNMDTTRESWQQMYSEVPESERSTFIEGSGLIVLDSIEDIYASLDRFKPWSSTAYTDLATDIIHRPDYGDSLRMAVTDGFDGKTKSEIIDFVENSDVEVGNDWIIERAVEDFLE
jgi:hypothetical protein